MSAQPPLAERERRSRTDLTSVVGEVPRSTLAFVTAARVTWRDAVAGSLGLGALGLSALGAVLAIRVRKHSATTGR